MCLYVLLKQQYVCLNLTMNATVTPLNNIKHWENSSFHRFPETELSCRNLLLSRGYEIVCEPQQCLIVNFEFSKPKMNACFSNKFPSFIYLQSSAAAMDYNANISSAKLFEEINLHILKIAWNSCYMLDWIANLQSYTSCWWWVCNMRTYVQCAYQIYKWFQWMRFIVEEATWGL